MYIRGSSLQCSLVDGSLCPVGSGCWLEPTPALVHVVIGFCSRQETMSRRVSLALGYLTYYLYLNYQAVFKLREEEERKLQFLLSL